MKQKNRTTSSKEQFTTEVETEKNSAFSISLCICTMNRTQELGKCLESVFQCTELPNEILVSDDSSDGQPTQAVTANYPTVIYQKGPRRGLGPNRNACIRSTKSSYIIFIDDDVCVPSDFFTVARQAIAVSDPKMIITGYEIKHTNGQAEKITPRNPDFWGLQRVPVIDQYQAIVINATIFPRSLFDRALFDENLRYGSEEIDIARHAISLGYQITYQDSLYVYHYPSLINRDQYKSFVNASRLYATTKAYWQYEGSLPKTLTYMLLAPLQLVGSAVRRKNPNAVLQALQSTTLAYRYLLTSAGAISKK